MSEPSRVAYEFGPFLLDAVKRRLVRNGEPVPLAPKVLETLLVLIDNRERVLTKDEIVKQVWGDTIVEEGGLTRNISILRKTLGEKPDEHQYVVTLPARGYQFVAEVKLVVYERLLDVRRIRDPERQLDERQRGAEGA